ncbi:hypothetical protein B566_EDAN001036 [Ephemera danica]|nr:hypothetical protein B566_EDAN001036 [Ephemera danica]
MASAMTPLKPVAANFNSNFIFPSPDALSRDPLLDKLLSNDIGDLVTLNDKLKANIVLKDTGLIHFVHINAQSLLSHFDYFYNAFMGLNIHVIAVSETWLQPCIKSSQISLPGYEIFRVDRLHKGGGGVAIFVRNDIKCKILATSKPEEKNKAEFIISELKFGYKKVLFTTIYRPPNTMFIDDIDDAISNMGAEYDHIIITGDLNIDILKETSMKKKLLDSFTTLGLSLTNYTDPTHIHSYRDLPTLIDIFACNNTQNIKSNGQIEAPGFSHHDLIYISYSIKSDKIRAQTITFRDKKKINTQSLRLDAAKITTNNLKDYNDVDEMVDYLRNEIIALYDQHAPLKTVKVKHKPTPWRTTEVVELEVRRDKAFAKYKNSKKKSGLVKHENPYFEEYRVLRNKCNQGTLWFINNLVRIASCIEVSDQVIRWPLIQRPCLV